MRNRHLSSENLPNTEGAQSLSSDLNKYSQSIHKDAESLYCLRQKPMQTASMNQSVKLRDSTLNRYSLISGKFGEAIYCFNTLLKHLTIKTHGAPCLTRTDRLVTGSRLAKQIDEIIKKEGFEVSRIILQICYSGAGGIASQAQQLANHLNVNVTGYLGKYTEIVRAGASSPADVNGGNIKIFTPMYSPARRRIVSSLNSTISSFVSGGIQFKKVILICPNNQ